MYYSMTLIFLHLTALKVISSRYMELRRSIFCFDNYKVYLRGQVELIERELDSVRIPSGGVVDYATAYQFVHYDWVCIHVILDYLFGIRSVADFIPLLFCSCVRSKKQLNCCWTSTNTAGLH